MTLKPLAALIAAMAFVATSLPAHAETTNPPNRIMVTGEGEMAVAPDMAVLSLSVLREAATARKALTANNEAMAAVLASMKEAGIAGRDLQTAGFNIAPRYVYPDPRTEAGKAPQIVGYTVTNTLSVRVHDLSKLGDILDRAVTLGVNQGGNLAFTNADPESAINEARKKAMADAIAKAKTLTQAAGIGIGRVLEISEQSFRPQPAPMLSRKMLVAAPADSVPVASGENTYSVTVNVTFELKQ